MARPKPRADVSPLPDPPMQDLPGVTRTIRRERPDPMPAEFDQLATYNAECARGIAHTAEWDAAMASLQRRFNEWAGLDG